VAVFLTQHLKFHYVNKKRTKVAKVGCPFLGGGDALFTGPLLRFRATAASRSRFFAGRRKLVRALYHL